MKTNTQTTNLEHIPPRNWITLIPHTLIQNYTNLKTITHNNSIVACCVKSNAYGFGITHVAGILSKYDPDCWFCVQDVSEGVELRKYGIQNRILLISAVFEDEFDLITSYNITPIHSDYTTTVAFIMYLVSHNLSSYAFHLQFDSGMGWLGLAENEVKNICTLAQENNVYIEGIATHFASSDEKQSSLYEQQKNRFTSLQNQVQKKFAITYFHCANTGAVINDPDLMQQDIIQPGIGLYGLMPSEYTYNISSKYNIPSFKLIGNLQTRVAQIKTIPKGAGVGYTWSHICTHDSTIAVLPIGYYNGIDRALSNKLDVYIDGQKCRQVGNIGMNSMMVDVTNIKDSVSHTSIVELFQNTQDIEKIAHTSSTISYEIIARLNDIDIKIDNESNSI